jgi:hypothetical protein
MVGCQSGRATGQEEGAGFLAKVNSQLKLLAWPRLTSFVPPRRYRFHSASLCRAKVARSVRLAR